MISLADPIALDLSICIIVFELRRGDLLIALMLAMTVLDLDGSESCKCGMITRLMKDKLTLIRHWNGMDGFGTSVVMRLSDSRI